jgi:hypothetical protein
LDDRLVAAMAGTPTACGEIADWRDLRQRARSNVHWDSLIVSTAAHVAAILILSTSLVSIDVVDLPKLLVELSTDVQPEPLEALSSGPGSVAEMQLEAAQEGPLLPSESCEPAEVSSPKLGDLGMDAGKTFQWKLPPPEELITPAPTDAPARQPRTASTSKQGNREDQKAPPAAKYFGTVAEGKRFVYILDMSSSMEQPSGDSRTAKPGHGTRFDRATAELLRSLSQLQPDQSFYVVLFSSEMRRMFDEDGPAQMLPATAENQKRLRRWINSVQPNGSTQPAGAIRLAISLQPSAIFLLSDGEFDGFTPGGRGTMFDADPLVRNLIGTKRQGQVPIHSFAFEADASKANMKALAELTGGQYRYIAPGGTQEPREPPPIPRPTTLAQGGPAFPAGSPEGLLEKADALRDSGQSNEAIQAYQELIRRYPITPAAVKARGRMIQLQMRGGNNPWSRR